VIDINWKTEVHNASIWRCIEVGYTWILWLQVVREHDPQGRDAELFRRHLYSPGNVGPTSKGSVGAELVDGLVIKEGDYKLVKTRFSAFFATHLHSFLRTEGIKSLVISGKCKFQDPWT
jgi:nicotinamidase-related amidase